MAMNKFSTQSPLLLPTCPHVIHTNELIMWITTKNKIIVLLSNSAAYFLTCPRSPDTWPQVLSTHSQIALPGALWHRLQLVIGAIDAYDELRHEYAYLLLRALLALLAWSCQVIAHRCRVIEHSRV